MPRFHYNAIDANGKPVAGEMDAADVSEVTARLEADGMRVESVRLVNEPTAEKPAPAQEGQGSDRDEVVTLRDSDFDRLSGQLGDLTASGVPLVGGLSAMAAELPYSRFRRGLLSIIRRLEAGGDLASVLKDHGAPADLQALVAAGVRTGQTGELLGRYAAESRRMADIKRQTFLSLSYPLVLLGLLSALLLFVLILLVPMFNKLFEDFGTELPFITRFVLGVSSFLVDHGLWLLAGLVAIGGAGVVSIVCVCDRITRRRWICRIPVVGRLLKFGALARFSHLLAILVENNVPLQDALLLAGDGSGDAELEAAGALMSSDVAAGEPLERAAYNTASIPATLIEAMTWHQQPGVFADALRALSKMYEARATAQTGVVSAVWQPIVVVAGGLAVGFVTLALFAPLLKLLNDLS